MGGARPCAGRDSLSLPDGYHEDGAVAGCVRHRQPAVPLEGPRSWLLTAVVEHRRGALAAGVAARSRGAFRLTRAASPSSIRPEGHVTSSRAEVLSEFDGYFETRTTGKHGLESARKDSLSVCATGIWETTGTDQGITGAAGGLWSDPDVSNYRPKRLTWVPPFSSCRESSEPICSSTI
jgi:hypothetical protein